MPRVMLELLKAALRIEYKLDQLLSNQKQKEGLTGLSRMDWKSQICPACGTATRYVPTRMGDGEVVVHRECGCAPDVSTEVPRAEP